MSKGEKLFRIKGTSKWFVVFRWANDKTWGMTKDGTQLCMGFGLIKLNYNLKDSHFFAESYAISISKLLIEFLKVKDNYAY